MAEGPRTVDNLGKQASIRYAENQKAIDQAFLEEVKNIGQKTETPGAAPYTPSEFETLFLIDKKTSWAQFSPPPEYSQRVGQLFFHGLVPSMGSLEDQDDRRDQLEALPDTEDKQTVLHCLDLIEHYDRQFQRIQADKNRYHKG